MEHTVAAFTLDSFEAEPPFHEDSGVQYGRTRITKTFTGDIEATSTVEMLSVRAEAGGAGYVALERVSGRVDGKVGGFALLHVGTMTAAGSWAKWPIAPGSGTGELAGISGEGRIEIGSDGAHTLFLDYDLA
ncbi:MAG: DUF3224 domain-containing protein [Acidimicrobiales bacterium]